MPEGSFGALAAILVMALVTDAIRCGGFWLMGYVRLTPRIGRMLEALPGSVVVATVVPIALKSGGAAMVGIAAVMALMLLWRNEFVAVFGAVAVVALLRAAGWS